MKIFKQAPARGQTAIALALLAAFSPTRAAAADELGKPASSISVGLGLLSGNGKDRAQFGIYNGLREHDANLLLDFDYRNRADAGGTWLKLEGRNLGMDNRELRGAVEQQGNWRLGAEYSEITKHSPYTINTGMTGAGSTTPSLVRLATPGAGAEVNLKTERKGIALDGQKWLTAGLLFEASFKSEDKDGARLWGRGYDCAAYVCGSSTATAINQANLVKNAILLLPEPINSTIKQFEAKLSFHDEKLAATAGYYGSYYNNANGNLTPTVPGSLNNGIGQAFPLYPAVSSAIIAGGGLSLQQVLQTPMALPPDNQAHQLYLDGNYAFTRRTKGSFKFAYTHATQDESFASQGLSGAPAGSGSLGGRVDSTLAQFGLSSRPSDKLSVVANWRYEHKEDKTPFALYNNEAVAVVPATTPASYVNSFWNNGHITRTTQTGKLEASYLLPHNYRASAGLDYNSLERSVPEDIKEEKTAGITAVRAKNWEYGYRLELMKSMAETFTGRVSYMNAQRRGSDWTSLSTLDPGTPGITAANLGLVNAYCGGMACYGQALPARSIVALSGTVIFPLQMTDVDREQWKATATWNPTERLALQITLQDGKDKTAAQNDPLAGGKGWRDTDLKYYSLDINYVLSENWKLTGYVSRGDSQLRVNHSTGYIAELHTVSDALGLGLSGKLTERLQLGASLSYFNDANEYGIDAAGSATGAPPSATNLAQAAIGLPDITLKKTTLNLFATYAWSPSADLRLNLLHQRAKLDEWVWGTPGKPFTYADNTTVMQQPDQNLSFLGIAYIYKWR